MKIALKDFLYIGAIIVLILLLMTQSCNNKKITNNETNLVNNLSDTLVKVTNKLGEEKTRTSILETYRTSDFIRIKSKDSILLTLQGKVKYYQDQLKNGGNVSVITNSTNINNTGETIIKYDTIYSPQSQIEIFPVYEMSLNNKWYQGNIKASQDSTTLNLQIDNEYSIVIGEEGKWYKKKTPFVEVTNNNPYTKTKTLKTYEVSKPLDKKFGLGIFLGYGIGVSGLTPMIGVGINYNLIKF